MRAIFLGKFQPPHLGHIRTIIQLLKKFQSVIIGITQSEPAMMPFVEVKNILQEVLGGYSNIQIILISGSIEGGTADIRGLPFDIIVSGNHKVINILKEQGFNTEFYKRTEGVGYSGSEIRSLSHVVSHDVTTQKMLSKEEVHFIPVSDLKPLEKILPAHYNNIEKMILDDGYIKKPLIVDYKFKIVLDGSYRYAFLLKLGFKFAPVIFVDYGDESIFVGNHLKHRYLKDDSVTIKKHEVVVKALHEKLFNPRTLRHFFPFRKNDVVVPLKCLEQGNNRDISFLMQNIPLIQEIEIDKAYIQELAEEIEILETYKNEQKEVKDYLLRQIEMMKEIE